MTKKKIENNHFKPKEIIYNVIVLYSNNITEHFDAIQITDKGIIIGRFIESKFVSFGVIPNDVCKKISIIK